MSARDEGPAGRRPRAAPDIRGPQEEQRPRPVAPPPPLPPARETSLRGHLRGPGALRRAMLLQAILGPPKALAEDEP